MNLRRNTGSASVGVLIAIVNLYVPMHTAVFWVAMLCIAILFMNNLELNS